MPRGVRNPAQVKVDLVNPNSPNATVASVKIDLWYQQLHIWERWTWQRFVRLAAFLKLTPEELASVVGVRHDRIADFQDRNHLYQLRNREDRSAALLLTSLEATVMKHFTKDVIENPFPKL